MMRIEETAVQLISSNAVITIPLTVTLLRILMSRIAADKREMVRSIFSIPEDLMYISIGIVLTGMAGQIPAFRNYYSDHANLSGFLLVLGLASVALVIHVLDQKWVQPGYERFHAADDKLKAKLGGRRDDSHLPAGARELGVVYFANFAFFSLVWLFEVSASIIATYYVLQPLQPR